LLYLENGCVDYSTNDDLGDSGFYFIDGNYFLTSFMKNSS
jgi:hypothetical protein